MAKTLIEVKHLKKYFPTPKGMLHAVDDVTFSIGEGKTMGVVGESGCGKSTLGRTLIHLYESTDGQIFFKGKDITHVGKRKLHELRKEMQIIFQDPFASLNPRMTVQETIMEPLELAGYHKSKLMDKTEEIMDMVGIDERLRHSYPHELDGGRRQRVGIGRALALDPAFVVCDEPVSALDVSIQAQVLNLLQDLQEKSGVTYMFVTHDLSVVKHISDEILVMYMGQMVEKAPSKLLFRRPLHPYTKGLLSAIPVPSIRKKRERIIMKGEITSPIDPKPGCRFAERCPHARQKCFQQSPVGKEIQPGHFASCHFIEEINGETQDQMG